MRKKNKKSVEFFDFKFEDLTLEDSEENKRKEFKEWKDLEKLAEKKPLKIKEVVSLSEPHIPDADLDKVREHMKKVKKAMWNAVDAINKFRMLSGMNLEDLSLPDSILQQKMFRLIKARDALHGLGKGVFRR
jgi:hypothetical protein